MNPAEVLARRLRLFILYAGAAAVFVAAALFLSPFTGMDRTLTWQVYCLVTRHPEWRAAAHPTLLGELDALWRNPGFLSGLLVGFFRVDNPRQLWRALLPLVYVAGPTLPLMFMRLTRAALLGFLPLLVVMCAPYALIGGALGMLGGRRLRRVKSPPPGSPP